MAIGIGIGIVALFLILFGPRISEGRRQRHQFEAAEERQNAPFWDGLAKQPPLFGHLDDAPEEYGTQANAVAAERARRAAHVSDLPHGTTRRGTHL